MADVFTGFYPDYLPAGQAAANGFAQGLVLTETIRDLYARRAQMERDQMFQSDLQALGQGATAGDYLDMLQRYPEKGSALKSGYEMLNTEQRQTMLGQFQPMYAALYNGQPQIARQLADDQATAAENAGDVSRAASLRSIGQMVRANPAIAQSMVGMGLAANMDPDQFKSMHLALDAPQAQQKAGMEAQKLGYETQRTAYQVQREMADAQAAAENARTSGERYAAELQLKRLQAEREASGIGYDQAREGRAQLEAERNALLGQQQLAKGRYEAQQLAMQGGRPQLSPTLENKTLEWDLAGEDKSRAAGVAADLAQKFRATSLPGGIPSMAGDLWDRFTGRDTPEAQLRMRLEQYVNTEAVKLLPPGPATDRDIELVRAGFPKRTSDSGLIARYLEAAGRLSEAGAAVDHARAEWMRQFGHLGAARRGGEINGTSVPVGTSFADYIKQTGGRAAQGGVQTRSYWDVLKK